MKSTFLMLLDSALQGGGHLGVSLPNLPMHLSTLPDNRRAIAAMVATLQANAVLLSTLHTSPKWHHKAVPFSGAPISWKFCPHM